jgi:tetratricopeptide (TPR) repeat protein
MKTISLIESYLSGEMDEQQRKEFENSIREDQVLTAEIKLLEETNEAVLDDEVHEFRKSIKKVINDSYINQSKTIEITRRFFKYPLVASIIVLIVASLWQLITILSPEKIYAKFYKPYETDLSTRSVNTSTDKISVAYMLYQKGDYTASYEILSNYLLKNTDNQTARFFLGMNSLELGKVDQAITDLKEVEKDNSTPYAIHARWYLSLAYLKTNDINEAKIYLNRIVEDDVFYAEQAKKILKKIKS